ncbi:MAG: glutamate-1-semialdehyde 2,1-aminomutase [Candidatus Electryoneaceae bacterium]|nr:glutamate-1-semialdehyde 2,1-aminomutase [Candidatus Electryoneaceae bacterium]
MVSVKSSILYKRACKSIPGGVNSPVRAFKNVGGTPPFISGASGCRVHEGSIERIDYIGSWGPMIAGHSHPSVVKAITAQASRGTSYGLPTELEIDLAEEVKKRMPSIELIRFVNSGTEAAMSAIRLARAFTERDKIIKFAGCYHGHGDAFLVEAGSGAATLGLPDSPGVTSGAVQDTLIARFNDLDSVEKLFNAHGDEISAIIVEPVAGNMGVIPPDDGFLVGLRKLRDRHKALLIFDEVMTGFRVARGGAQQLYDIRPDLTLMGKIIGGGLPVGAFGGREDIMEMLAPNGKVYQAGTLSGNPLAMAAGLATLKLLNKAAYERLEWTSFFLEKGLKRAAMAAGIDVQVQRVGSMMTLFFTDKPVKNYDDAKNADHVLFSDFFKGMFQKGILLPPSGYESWFLSTMHDDKAVIDTLEAAKEVFGRVMTITGRGDRCQASVLNK